jgi:hypothetical protein
LSKQIEPKNQIHENAELPICRVLEQVHQDHHTAIDSEDEQMGPDMCKGFSLTKEGE